MSVVYSTRGSRSVLCIVLVQILAARPCLVSLAGVLQINHSLYFLGNRSQCGFIARYQPSAWLLVLIPWGERRQAPLRIIDRILEH